MRDANASQRFLLKYLATVDENAANRDIKVFFVAYVVVIYIVCLPYWMQCNSDLKLAFTIFFTLTVFPILL